LDGGAILLSALAAALVVITGAVYALFFALGRLHRSASCGRIAGLAYGLLVVSTVVLARSLDLHGAWLWIVAVMLVGYLLAPYAIWHLSSATHAGADEPASQ